MGTDALDSITDVLAGSLRGVAQVVVGHPLDTIKVRMQTQSQVFALNNNHRGFTSTSDCLYKTWKFEGIRGLYRGASSPLAGCMFYSSFLFFCYGRISSIVNGWHPSGFFTSNTEMYLRSLLIGASTGICASLIEGPVDVVKSKLQVQMASKLLESQGIQKNPLRDVVIKKGAIATVVEIVRRRGIRALYQGFSATLLRNSIGSMFYFACFEHVRKLLDTKSIIDNSIATRYVSETVSILIAGGSAGLIFWLSIYPVDVVKGLLQTDSSDPSQRRFRSATQCAKYIWKTEGWRGFSHGLNACIIRSVPVNAVSFMTFEGSKALMIRWQTQLGLR